MYISRYIDIAPSDANATSTTPIHFAPRALSDRQQTQERAREKNRFQGTGTKRVRDKEKEKFGGRRRRGGGEIDVCLKGLSEGVGMMCSGAMLWVITCAL